MGSAPRSSFIPRQITGAIPKKVKRTRVFSVFGFLGGAFLFASLLASAGVFFYKDLAARALETEKLNLTTERKKFNESDIVGVRNFDQRLVEASDLLDEHIAPSKIFDALELRTKQSVQYTNFSYSRRPSGDVTLSLSGITDEFAKVALQSFQYMQDVVLKDAVFTEVGLGESNVEGEGESTKQVSFSLVSNVTASKLQYGPAGNSEAKPMTETEVLDFETTVSPSEEEGQTAPSNEESE